MSVVVIFLVFILTVGVGAALAKGVLTLVLHLIVEREAPSGASLRTAAFLGALFIFWSLAPAIAESPAPAGFLTLVR